MEVLTGYIRVSDRREEGVGLGEETQKRSIIEYCKYKGYGIKFVKSDMGVSGGKPLEKRKGGKELLESLDNGAKKIIVFKLDRLGRSVADISSWIENFRQRGITIISVSENFDLETLSGWILASHLIMFGEIERRMGSERMLALHQALFEMGRLQSQAPPYGWDVGEGKKLTENPEQQKVIRLMKNLRSRGWKERAIARHLNEKGIPAQKGGEWRATTIIKILDRNGKKKKPTDHQAEPASEPAAPVEDFISPIYSDPPSTASD